MKDGSRDKEEAYYPLLTRELHEMEDGDIDVVLAAFIQQARNQKGERYPPKTLFEMTTSLQKHLELKGVKKSILNKDTFPNVYYALDVSMKASTSEGLGMNSKQAENISPAQEKALWEKKIIDVDTPKGLLNALFYAIGVHFALHGGKST